MSPLRLHAKAVFFHASNRATLHTPCTFMSPIQLHWSVLSYPYRIVLSVSYPSRLLENLQANFFFQMARRIAQC